MDWLSIYYTEHINPEFVTHSSQLPKTKISSLIFLLVFPDRFYAKPFRIYWQKKLFPTFNCPIADDTFTIVGESDNWRRGISASTVILVP